MSSDKTLEPAESRTANSAAPPSAKRKARWRGLSDKLLLLTVSFVMLAEVMIYVPSIANFQLTWLRERLETATVILLATSAGRESGLSTEEQGQILAATGIEAIAVRGGGQRWMIARDTMPSEVAKIYNLTKTEPLRSIADAFDTLLSSSDRKILAIGPPPAGYDHMEIILPAAGLREAMLIYSRNILVLSLIISAITAALVYLALKALIVRPIQRLTENMLEFSEDPEAADRIIEVSKRRDEVGVAEARLAAMQTALQSALGQRRHLADLGLAVSKINHDLRNILASAQLFSDRLETSQDPTVKRLAPKIINAIDRAIGYTRSVLDYGKASEAPPRRQLVSARRVGDDVAEILMLPGHQRIAWENQIPGDLEIEADPEQLFRVVMNLCRNAVQILETDDDPALVKRLWLEGERSGGMVHLRVCDTGPGVAERARENLFKPFEGSARPGGTGLGLAIAAELVRAHGGEIALVHRPLCGAVFEITIPDRPVPITKALRDDRLKA